MGIIFSCCLYGNNNRYIDPLFKNNLDEISSSFKLKCEFYLYCNVDVEQHTINALIAHGYIVKVIDFNAVGMGPMFIRYLPIIEELSDIVCIRDSDCCYTSAEIHLLNQWIDSKYEFHIIRGHKLHIYPIMGGLFSIRGKLKGKFSRIFKERIKYAKSSNYNKDQIFLAKFIYPEIVSSSLVHSVRVAFEREHVIHFASERSGFIGQTILDDKKRKKEAELSQSNMNLIVFKHYIPRLITNKICAKIISFIAVGRKS